MTAVEISQTPANPRNYRPDHRRDRIEEWGPGDRWERQPAETARAYETFLAYLHQDVRPRTIAGAAAARGDRRGVYSSDLSARYRWRERAAAYDEHMERVRVETERAEREQMAVRHVKIALDGQAKLAAALEKLTVEDAYEMLVKKPGEAWRLLEGAARLERESRGVTPQEAADAAQGTPGVQFARALLMNDEALEKWQEALDLVSEATVAQTRRPVLDAATGEPLDVASRG